MSASLVGSEMCIRDRPLSGCLERADRAASLPAAEGSTNRWSFQLKTDAVSYTHLTLPTICSV
eukprot:5940945-Alexandrium_andersonii.AAC.1